jgi:hypothetical protein
MLNVISAVTYDILFTNRKMITAFPICVPCMQSQIMYVNGSYPEEALKQTTSQALYLKGTSHTDEERAFTCLFGIAQHYRSKMVFMPA